MPPKPNSFIAYENVDLTGVNNILFRPNWHLYDIYPGGKAEIRLDSPDGELIGETVIEKEQFNTRYRGAFGGLGDMTPEQKKRTQKYPPINEREFFARGSDKNAFTIPSIATLTNTEGLHDLYFIFRNDSVEVTESIFPLAEIEVLE